MAMTSQTIMLFDVIYERYKAIHWYAAICLLHVCCGV